MKKYINNKVYDTETAHLVGEWDNEQRGSFSYCEETLYRKRTGEYFLYGKGGPMSKYARSEGQNSWGSGDAITPVTAAKAREWAEKKLTTEEYDEEFGAPSEDAENVVLSLSIPATVADKARKAAADKSVSLSAYIAELIANS